LRLDFHTNLNAGSLPSYGRGGGNMGGSALADANTAICARTPWSEDAPGARRTTSKSRKAAAAMGRDFITNLDEVK
jgi:hypothetical protein